MGKDNHSYLAYVIIEGLRPAPERGGKASLQTIIIVLAFVSVLYFALIAGKGTK